MTTSRQSGMASRSSRRRARSRLSAKLRGTSSRSVAGDGGDAEDAVESAPRASRRGRTVSAKSSSAVSRSTEAGARSGEFRSGIFDSLLLAPRSLLFIRPRCAGGDSGGDVEGQEAFAEAGVGYEERDAAEGDSVGPEPADFLGGELGETHGAGDILARASWSAGVDEGARRRE